MRGKKESDNFDLEECKKQIVEELEGTFLHPIRQDYTSVKYKDQNNLNIDIDYDSEFEDKRRRIMFTRRNNRRKKEISKEEEELSSQDQVEIDDIELQMTSNDITAVSAMPAGYVEESTDVGAPVPAGDLPKKTPSYHSLKVNTNYNKRNTPAGSVPSSSSSGASTARRSKLLIAHGETPQRYSGVRQNQGKRPTSTRSTMTYASTNRSVASSVRDGADESVTSGKKRKGEKSSKKNPRCQNCSCKLVCVFIYDLLRSLPIIPLAFAIASIYVLNRVSSNTRIIMNKYDDERLFENEMPNLSEIYSHLNNIFTFVVMLNIMIGCMNLFFTGATLDLFVANFCGSTSFLGIFGRTVFTFVELLFGFLSLVSSVLILGVTGVVCALGASFILTNAVCNTGVDASENSSEWSSRAKILEVGLNTILSWIYTEPVISINASEMSDYCEKASMDMLSPDVETLGDTERWRQSIIFSFAAVVFQFGLTLSILRIYLTTRYTLLKLDKTKEIETSQLYIEGKKMPIYKPCIEEETDLKFGIVDDYLMEEVKTEEPLHILH